MGSKVPHLPVLQGWPGLWAGMLISSVSLDRCLGDEKCLLSFCSFDFIFKSNFVHKVEFEVAIN